MTPGLPSLSSSMGSLGASSPQGDGGYDANGVMRVKGQRPRYSTGQPPQPQQTFAQMQAQGMARPAPQQVRPQQVQPYQSDPNAQQFTGQLQGAVSSALQTPSRYDLPQVQQVRDALTNQLEQQFHAQKSQLDEENARRGLLSSSIGAGYQGDLAGQQANTLASMNAGLIQDAAGNYANDRNSALSAGQTFQNNAAQQGLAGYSANLSGTEANNAANLAALQNRQQFGLQGQQLDLSRQQVANQASQFGQTYNLEQNAQQNQQQQFKDQLAQQLGLATMGDKTANRGIDVQGQLANSDLILRIAQLLGLPTGTTGSTLGGSAGAGGAAGGGAAAGHGGATGGLGGGTGTTGGVGGDGSDPVGKGGVVGGQQQTQLSPELIQQLLHGGGNFGSTPYSYLDPAYGGGR